MVAPSGGAYAGHGAGAPATRSWDRTDDEPFDVLENRPPPGYDDGYDDLRPEDEEDGARRHRLVVIGLPLLALAVVIALAWWIGDALLSVSGSVDDDVQGSTPSVSAPADGSAGGTPAGAPVTIVGGDVFDPQGDGDPDHPEDVPLAFDGDPATAWSTYEYRGSPAFGNLKDGLGLVLDLGGPQSISGVSVTSTRPGATVEIRVAEAAGIDLDSFAPAADGTLEGTTEFAFDEPVTAGFVLVWITELVPSEGGFSADIAEIEITTAG
jgi:hypothetical protein